MDFFEMMCGEVNDFSVLVYASEEDAQALLFMTDGKLRHWEKRPSVQPYVEKRRKKQKPLADFAVLAPGSMFLSARANDLVGPFLRRFGQLLEVDCNGEVRYWFNVTNLVPCIDFEKSEKVGNSIKKAAFLAEAIPTGAHILKDPRTAISRIYATSEAKAFLEENIAEAGLTGLAFFKAGEGRYS